MRIIISGGGTGGHVYPALAVVAELRQQPDPPEMRWVGSVGGMEQALVERADLTFESIAASGLRGKNPAALLQGMWTLGQGYFQSRRMIRRFQPDVLFVTGGYVCVPVTMAARQAGVPVIIYLPDIEPGLAIKFLARLANRVAVTAEESRQFFRFGQAVVTGYPVRAGLAEPASGQNKAEIEAGARRQLGLRPDLPVLLVFGGSRGARSINRAVAADIEALLAVSQVVHVSGSLDEAWVKARRAELPAALQARYQVAAYLHEEMIAALQAADLVVSRAGASILGEFPAAGLPAILVPYPYAGAHQSLNAAYLAKAGAALVIEDAELDLRLKDTVLKLIGDQNKLRAMQTASSSLARPEAASRLAQEILEVGSHGN